MDLQPTDDQNSLVEMITGFAADRFPIEIVRSYGEQGGFDRSRWSELAALGTFGIAVPEESGGVGLNFIDAVLVHEALGAALVPGPLVAATVAAGIVDGVIDGSVVPCLIDLPHDGPLIVEHFRSADVLLVVSNDGVNLVPCSELNGSDVLHPTDPTTPVTVLASLPAGESVGGRGREGNGGVEAAREKHDSAGARVGGERAAGHATSVKRRPSCFAGRYSSVSAASTYACIRRRFEQRLNGQPWALE